LDAVGSDIGEVLRLGLEERGSADVAIHTTSPCRKARKAVLLGGRIGRVKEALKADSLLACTHLVSLLGNALTLGKTALTHIVGIQDLKVSTLTAEVNATGSPGSTGSLLGLGGFLSVQARASPKVSQSLLAECVVDSPGSGVERPKGGLRGLSAKATQHSHLVGGVTLLHLLGRGVQVAIEAEKTLSGGLEASHPGVDEGWRKAFL
jgi:hypothetical protein